MESSAIESDDSSEWNGCSDSDSDDGGNANDRDDVVPFSNPPPGHKLLTHKYASLEDLEADLHEYCAKARFAIIRLRCDNKFKDFGYTRYYYGCARGKIRASRAHSRRTSTAKVGCP